MAAELAAQAEAAAPASIGIMQENWTAMRLFLSVETQWRRAGLAGLATGLDYAALPVAAAALGVALDADLFGRLRILEGAALAAMMEAARRQ